MQKLQSLGGWSLPLKPTSTVEPSTRVHLGAPPAPADEEACSLDDDAKSSLTDTALSASSASPTAAAASGAGAGRGPGAGWTVGAESSVGFGNGSVKFSRRCVGRSGSGVFTGHGPAL